MKPGARSCSARPIPISCRSSTRPRRRRVSPARRRLRRARATCSRSAAGCSTSARPAARYPDVFLPLHGAHQGDNAAIALAAAEAFVGAPLAARGRARRVHARASPGRLEVVGRHPLVLLDGAHNVAGARGVARRARRGVRAGAAHARRRPAAREGTARDADRARPRRRRAARVRAGRRARARSTRRHRQGRGRARLPRGAHRGRRHASPRRCRARCSSTPADGQIVITGSLYFVGAARGMLVDR